MEFIVPVWLYRRGDGEQPRSTDAHATAATPLRKLPWLPGDPAAEPCQQWRV